MDSELFRKKCRGARKSKSLSLQLICGKESPYARHTEYASIEAITWRDLVDFYEDKYSVSRSRRLETST